MWESDSQACKTIIAMLRSARMDGYWTAEGPTPEACDLMDRGGGPLSHGEQVMLRCAFDLWNGKGAATLDDLVNVLDPKNLRSVLQAVLVLRSDAGSLR